MNQQTPPPSTPEPAATPPPERAATPPPPPAAADGKASGLVRALGVLAAIILGFAAAVVIGVMLDIMDKPLCEDVGGALAPTEDCYDISSGVKPIALALGWAGGVLAVVAALAFLRLTFTGRGARLALQLTGAAVVLAAISIAIA